MGTQIKKGKWTIANTARTSFAHYGMPITYGTLRQTLDPLVLNASQAPYPQGFRFVNEPEINNFQIRNYM